MGDFVEEREFYSDKPGEECGIFGVISANEPVAYLTYLGLFALQHRGQESAGIAVGDGRAMDTKRGMGLLTDVFRNGLPELKGDKAIGHVRYSTAGASIPVNTQPLMVSFSGGNLALAHNGNLTNVNALKRELADKGAFFHTSMDTEALVAVIISAEKQAIGEKIAESMKKVEGAFSLALLTDDKLVAVRDKFGFRPLCIGRLADGWAVASESCALDAAGAKFVRDVEPGEVVVFTRGGQRPESFFYDKGINKAAHCVFEYIYFARTDSIIDGRSVYLSRIAMGRELARENPDLKERVDAVFSVPDSGTTAAIGFGMESGVPFLEGLNKNRYVGRTFIQPTQQKRDVGVRMKLNPVRPLVEGKAIAIVDDSIVRGTTSGKILKLLRDAGARELHMLISSPPILYPCYYGIDTAVRKELISATHTGEEIRQYIGADSLRFVSLAGLRRALDAGASGTMCYACFNGEYPLWPQDQPGSRQAAESGEMCQCRGEGK
ncbi:MAG: amidophosphoribosyltransferase [Acidaminococcales bacterium]|jgi:amidophosphoribosyltransferase|nr:amidophosphoribosyltransferase [Acidaminococcales bacterium]